MSGHQPNAGEPPPPPAPKQLHQCSWPGCQRHVSREMWGCRAHWYALPNNLRSWIGRAYRNGIMSGRHPTRSYVKAYRAALAWIEENGGEHREKA